MDNFRMPLIGEKAPEFKANSTIGSINFPSDYKGKWVIFFSHPGDFTPVCTTELMTFASMRDQFNAKNAELLGLSVDSNPSHIAWVKAMNSYNWKGMSPNINFPIIADDFGNVARTYGMLMPSSSATKTVRNVYLIDPEGTVRAIIAYPLTTGRSMKEIFRLLQALQAYDKTGNPTPAEWQSGEDQLYPAPVTLSSAQKKSNSCLDWYLCFANEENSNAVSPSETNMPMTMSNVMPDMKSEKLPVGMESGTMPTITAMGNMGMGNVPEKKTGNMPTGTTMSNMPAGMMGFMPTGMSMGNMPEKETGNMPTGTTMSNMPEKEMGNMPAGTTMSNMPAGMMGFMPTGMPMGNMPDKETGNMPAGTTMSNMPAGVMDFMPTGMSMGNMQPDMNMGNMPKGMTMPIMPSEMPDMQSYMPEMQMPDISVVPFAPGKSNMMPSDMPMNVSPTAMNPMKSADPMSGPAADAAYADVPQPGRPFYPDDEPDNKMPAMQQAAQQPSISEQNRNMMSQSNVGGSFLGDYIITRTPKTKK